ncbi:MAG: 5'-methylthioadenosine/adenosylhomocysteine nucleosidase [Firmicutes bacterium]|nr:5'-methylthioadenosine/adenosylhomocysteine nucleosidase [Bacillota bacterium]
MKIGIIGAMAVEIAEMKAHMAQITVKTRAGMDFYEGTLAGLPVTLVQSGVGKVNAAMCAQILCGECAVTHVVNTGVAGSLCPELDIGDLVVSGDAMYHDFDCGGLDYPIGQVPGMPVLTFPADEQLVALAFQAAEMVNPGHTRIGRVASGDQFVAEKGQKAAILAHTGALCTEMEGTAIAHTAYRNSVPFVVLRAISDKADDSAQMDYPTFEAIAAQRCARVTMALLKALKEGE